MLVAAVLFIGATQVNAGSKPVTVTVGAVLPYLRPIAFAPAPTGSRMLVCMEDGSVRVVDSKTHATLKVLAKHPQPAYAAAWSADGLYVATGDETARIFVESPVSGAMIRQYRTHTKGIQKLSFNSTREYLISTGRDDQINVYDLTSPSTREVRKILGKGANFYGATCSPTLPFSMSTGILGPGGRSYDIATGKETGFLVTQDDQGVFDVAYNDAGTRLVTAEKCGDAVEFDAKTLEKIGTLKGHQDFVMYAAFSPNGNLLATGSSDRTVRIWDAHTLKPVCELQNECTVASPVCFSADGSTLATVSDQGYLQFNAVSPNQAAPSAPAKKPAKKASKRRRRHHAS